MNYSLMYQSPLVALVYTSASSHPYIVACCVAFWIYRTSTARMVP